MSPDTLIADTNKKISKNMDAVLKTSKLADLKAATIFTGMDFDYVTCIEKGLVNPAMISLGKNNSGEEKIVYSKRNGLIYKDETNIYSNNSNEFKELRAYITKKTGL